MKTYDVDANDEIVEEFIEKTTNKKANKKNKKTRQKTFFVISFLLLIIIALSVLCLSLLMKVKEPEEKTYDWIRKPVYNDFSRADYYINEVLTIECHNDNAKNDYKIKYIIADATDGTEYYSTTLKGGDMVNIDLNNCIPKTAKSIVISQIAYDAITDIPLAEIRNNEASIIQFDEEINMESSDETIDDDESNNLPTE